jgi:hypothetical protein
LLSKSLTPQNGTTAVVRTRNETSPDISAYSRIYLSDYWNALNSDLFFPQRNLLTKTLYWLCTLAPRIGSISDKTWVMVNGIGLLYAGVVMLTLSVVYLTYPSSQDGSMIHSAAGFGRAEYSICG